VVLTDPPESLISLKVNKNAVYLQPVLRRILENDDLQQHLDNVIVLLK